MDFQDAFQAQFDQATSYTETDLELNKKLQNTRQMLQDALSEIESQAELINLLYSEARIEQVATGELLAQVPKATFRNVALPRNADALSTSEKAGYAVYYMKFLGFATRKVVEEHEETKGHLEQMHKSIKKQTIEDPTIKRTGSIKIPELDGQKEIKRNTKTTAPLSPPSTPPEKSAKPRK